MNSFMPQFPPLERPAIHIGWDLGIRRDTAAVAGVYHDPRMGIYCMKAIQIWEPPVRVASVVEYVVHCIDTQNVVGIWLDPWQLMGEAQKLSEMGHSHIVHEVNQQAESVAFSNCLKANLDAGTFAMINHPVLKNHFAWCNVEVGERGWRIVKRRQSRPIDGVVATAMALYGATQDHSSSSKSAFAESRHNRSLTSAA